MSALKCPNIVHCLAKRELDSSPSGRLKKSYIHSLQSFAEEKASRPRHFQICKGEVCWREALHFLEISANGKRIASGCSDYSIQITDVETGNRLYELYVVDVTPWCIQFHPTDNSILATGCIAGELFVWMLHSDEPHYISRSSEERERKCISALSFHPEGSIIVYSIDIQLCFLDWRKQELIATCSTGSSLEKIRWVKFDRTGTRLYTGIANLNSDEQREDSLSSTSMPYEGAVNHNRPREENVVPASSADRVESFVERQPQSRIVIVHSDRHIRNEELDLLRQQLVSSFHPESHTSASPSHHDQSTTSSVNSSHNRHNPPTSSSVNSSHNHRNQTSSSSVNPSHNRHDQPSSSSVNSSHDRHNPPTSSSVNTSRNHHDQPSSSSVNPSHYHRNQPSSSSDNPSHDRHDQPSSLSVNPSHNRHDQPSNSSVNPSHDRHNQLPSSSSVNPSHDRHNQPSTSSVNPSHDRHDQLPSSSSVNPSHDSHNQPSTSSVNPSHSRHDQPSSSSVNTSDSHENQGTSSSVTNHVGMVRSRIQSSLKMLRPNRLDSSSGPRRLATIIPSLRIGTTSSFTISSSTVSSTVPSTNSYLPRTASTNPRPRTMMNFAALIINSVQDTSSRQTTHYRIQAWNVSEYLPDLADCTSNVIVRKARLHSDSYIDISKDGKIMCVQAYSDSMETVSLSVFSLQPETLGQCLFVFDDTRVLDEQRLRSISISPTGRFILVGNQTFIKHLDKQSIQVLQMKSTSHGCNMLKEIFVLNNFEGTPSRRLKDIYCARWLPEPGQGFVYLNAKGKLIILRPGNPENDEKLDSDPFVPEPEMENPFVSLTGEPIYYM